MKSIMRLFCIPTTFLILCAVSFAQDPAWHQVPKDSLSEHSKEIIQIMLTTTDESVMLDMIKQPGESDDILKLKMFAYKRIGTHGSKAAIPLLVTKLDIDKEGFYARYALESIPGPEIDAAFCESLKNLKRPEAVAGVLTSLGVRANPASTATVKEYLKHENAEIRKAAAYAFACCADDAAIDFFCEKSLDVEQADSGFLLAEVLLKKGKKEKAVKIYDALAATDIKPYQKESAVYGGILARGNDGIDLLVAQLNAETPKMFLVGLKAGRELPAGAAATQAMIDQLDKQDDPIRKSRLVRSVGDRKDNESKAISLPVISELAKGGEERVRIAAIDSLRNIGDASVLPILIAAANQADAPAVAEASRNVLANLPGKEIDNAIVELLDKGDKTAKTTAIGLVEERRIISAFPLLKKNMQDSDSEIRKAALDAIAQVASIDDLPMLFEVLSATKNEQDAKEVQHVLLSACTRMPQEAAAKATIKMFDSASMPVKLFLFDLLKQIGGPLAVQTVESYAFGNDDQLKDKATAVFGQWSKPEDIALVADACLKIARQSRENKYKVRGLRGAIRFARQFEMPEEKRLEICDQAFALANRNEEKLLVIDVYWRKPTLKMLAATMKHIDTEVFREKACETAVTICEKLQGKSPEIADAMKKVLEKSTNSVLKDKAQIVLNRQ